MECIGQSLYFTHTCTHTHTHTSVYDIKSPRLSLTLTSHVFQLTLDRGLFASFEAILRQQLDPIWHTLGPSTRQRVLDLRELRRLTELLFQYDCVSFYHHLLVLRSAKQAQWLLLDRADDLFVAARQRVYRSSLVVGREGKVEDIYMYIWLIIYTYYMVDVYMVDYIYIYIYIKG